MKKFAILSILFAIVNIAYTQTTYCEDNLPQSNLPDTIFAENPIVLEADSNYLSYQWSTGSLLPFIQVDFSGVYYLTITDDSSCISIDTIVVSIFLATISPADTLLCSPDSVVIQFDYQSGTNVQSVEFTNQSFIEFSDSELPSGQEQRTIEFWINLDSQSFSRSIFSYGNILNGTGFEILLDAQDTLQLKINGDTYSCPTLLPVNVWTHVAITIDEYGKYSFYFDGDFQFIGFLNSNFSTISGGAARLGALPLLSNSFVGLIDELKIWSRALSSQEIGAFSQTHLSSLNDSTLKVYFSFNQLVQNQYFDAYGRSAGVSAAIPSIEMPFPWYYHLLQIDSQWYSPMESIVIWVDSFTTLFINITDGLMHNTDSFEATVAPAIDFSNELYFCNQDSFLLQSPNQYENYLWSTGEIGSAIVVDMSGSYSLTASIGSCVFSDSLELNFSAITIDGGNVSVCEGDTIHLQANSSNGLYYWSNDAVSSSITIIPTASTYYSVMTFDGTHHCYDSVFVQVNTPPTINMPDTVILCNESSYLLNSGLPSYYSFEWNTGSVSASINITESDTYSLTVSNVHNCTTVAHSRVDFLLIDIFQSDTILCGPELLSLGLESNFPFEWSNGATQSFIEVFVSQPTVVSAQIVYSNQFCADSVEFILGGDIESGLPDTVSNCTGGLITVIANSIYNTYEWSDNQIGNEASFDESGIYFLTISDNYGCLSVDSLLISSIFATISLSSDTVCEGELVVLNSNTNDFEVLWNNGSTDAVLFENPIESTDYVLSLTDGFLWCDYNASVEVIVVGTSFISGQTDILAGSEVYQYSVDFTPGSEYHWVVSGGIVDSVYQHTIWVIWNNPGNGFLQVQETSINGCLGLPVSLDISILGINQLETGDFIVFPNPFQSGFTLDYLGEGNFMSGEIEIYAIDFRLIASFPISSKTMSIDLSNECSGVYFLRNISNPNYWLKIIKQ